jgi:hypothetical protein
MSVVVNIDRATVRTATVQIRALTIDGKQMTMAVFRQLQWADPMEWSELRPRGPLWGRVEYFWKPDHNECATHIVWQLGDELRMWCFGHRIPDPAVQAWHLPELPPVGATEKVRAWRSAWDAAHEKWSKIRSQLLALEQLFIAA